MMTYLLDDTIIISLTWGVILALSIAIQAHRQKNFQAMSYLYVWALMTGGGLVCVGLGIVPTIYPLMVAVMVGCAFGGQYLIASKTP
jgi:hypothetical protein